MSCSVFVLTALERSKQRCLSCAAANFLVGACEKNGQKDLLDLAGDVFHLVSVDGGCLRSCHGEWLRQTLCAVECLDGSATFFQ